LWCAGVVREEGVKGGLLVKCGVRCGGEGRWSVLVVVVDGWWRLMRGYRGLVGGWDGLSVVCF
jgi:hypothetical protein